MASPNKVGGSKYNSAITRGLNATQVTRSALRRILNDPGPLTKDKLLALAGVELGEIENALNELREIGRLQKPKPKPTVQKIKRKEKEPDEARAQ